MLLSRTAPVGMLACCNASATPRPKGNARAVAVGRKMCVPVSAYAAPAPPALEFDVPRQLPLHLVPLNITWAEVEGGVCAPRGFKAQGMYAGLRESGHRADLALLVSTQDAAVATALGSTLGCAPAVAANQERLAKSSAMRAVLITDDAGPGSVQGCNAAASSVGQALALRLDEILHVSVGGGCSFGERAAAAIPVLVKSLGADGEAAHHAACALATGDTICKTAALQVSLGAQRNVRLGGMAHGDAQGMQAVVTCDATVAEDVWQAMFGRALGASFEQVALPGRAGRSPADSLVALANGAAGGPMIVDEASEDAIRLEGALTALMQGLAKEVAWDADGARCLVEVEVRGAPNQAAARAAALSVASSADVCAAVRACDPDWATVIEAVSASGVRLDRDSLRISIGSMPLLHHGRPSQQASSAAAYCREYLHAQIGRHGEVRIQVEIGEGPGQGKAWGSGASCLGASTLVAEEEEEGCIF